MTKKSLNLPYKWKSWIIQLTQYLVKQYEGPHFCDDQFYAVNRGYLDYLYVENLSIALLKDCAACTVLFKQREHLGNIENVKGGISEACRACIKPRHVSSSQKKDKFLQAVSNKAMMKTLVKYCTLFLSDRRKFALARKKSLYIKRRGEKLKSMSADLI